MGLGGTTKKLQKVMDAAEQLYSRMNEVLQRLSALEEDVEETSSQVDHIERDIAEQRALLEALAKSEGIDTEAVLDNADLPPEPSAKADADAEADTDADADTEADSDDTDGTTVDVTEET